MKLGRFFRCIEILGILAVDGWYYIIWVCIHKKDSIRAQGVDFRSA